MWQAKTVQSQLAAHGIASELVPVKSLGDLKLDQPLYELGVTGVFTKTLDLALLAGEIDLAVHSYKDVPTVLAKGLSTAAVLKRASTADVLVHKSPDFTTSGLQIATSSLRRKAQWLAKYPEHQLVDIRGNVQTRLEKLANNSWGGAIFAAAGLARLDLLPENAMRLDWMVPAPAQGAMVVVAQSAHTVLLEELSVLNDFQTALCTQIEREFLNELEGGCTAPIGALCTTTQDQLHFIGVLHSLDGKQHIETNTFVPLDQAPGYGRKMAQKILSQGGKALMAEIKKSIIIKEKP
jgi:hydroxymethylbilane synthase